VIHIFVGTKAQFIKMVPIIMELQNRGISYNYIDSGQHAELTRELRKVFKIAEPNISLNSRTKDITSISKAIHWFLTNIIKSSLDRKWLKNYVFPEKGICLIHGDTISTLLGAFMAVLARVRVCHVEAGLRSYNWFDPFPEEIIRMICMRFSKILFAPSRDAFENLKKLNVRGAKIFVEGNTVIDAIRYIKKNEPQKHNKEKYAVATCHRLETISDRARLSEVVDLLNQVAKKMLVVFVVHKPTIKYLKKFELNEKLHENIMIKSMLDYPEFLNLVTSSEMVLTDGGSIQEECAFLNKKCLIIRNKTERKDGIGINAMLWGFDKHITEKFINWKTIADKQEGSSISPSKKIVDCLIRKGYS